MRTRDYRDIVGGAALIGVGAFVAIHAFTSYRLGTVTNMGPGLFPTALGCLLAALGVIVLVPALFRSGDLPQIDFRPLVTILVSIFTFAVMVRPFGLVPTILVLTLLASLAAGKLSLVGALVLAAGLSILATLIFPVGLGIQVAIIAWPW